MKICSVEGCSGPLLARTFCMKHYARYMKYGSPHVVKCDKNGPKVCIVEDCRKKVDAKGYCSSHYARYKRQRDSSETGICSVVNCTNKVDSKGYCKSHYSRFMRHGDPLAGRTNEGAPHQWLLENMYYDGDECLSYPFAKSNGYGAILIDGTREGVHAIVCTIHNGARPSEKHEVRHLCGNGHLGCVTPKHLKWGTRHENIMDKVVHGTHNRGENNVGSKLTSLDVLAICQDNRSSSEISKDYGVSTSAIEGIRYGRNWRWLTGINNKGGSDGRPMEGAPFPHQAGWRSCDDGC